MFHRASFVLVMKINHRAATAQCGSPILYHAREDHIFTRRAVSARASPMQPVLPMEKARVVKILFNLFVTGYSTPRITPVLVTMLEVLMTENIRILTYTTNIRTLLKVV